MLPSGARTPTCTPHAEDSIEQVSILSHTFVTVILSYFSTLCQNVQYRSTLCLIPWDDPSHRSTLCPIPSHDDLSCPFIPRLFITPCRATRCPILTSYDALYHLFIPRFCPVLPQDDLSYPITFDLPHSVARRFVLYPFTPRFVLSYGTTRCPILLHDAFFYAIAYDALFHYYSVIVYRYRICHPTTTCSMSDNADDS